MADQWEGKERRARGRPSRSDVPASTAITLRVTVAEKVALAQLSKSRGYSSVATCARDILLSRIDQHVGVGSIAERLVALSVSRRETSRRLKRETVQRNYFMRRARDKAAFVEYVDPDVVYARGGGLCGICNRSLLRDELTIDHVIPVSKGGKHAYWNVQAAHGRCNSRKGASVS